MSWNAPHDLDAIMKGALQMKVARIVPPSDKQPCEPGYQGLMHASQRCIAFLQTQKCPVAAHLMHYKGAYKALALGRTRYSA